MLAQDLQALHVINMQLRKDIKASMGERILLQKHLEINMLKKYFILGATALLAFSGYGYATEGNDENTDEGKESTILVNNEGQDSGDKQDTQDESKEDKTLLANENESSEPTGDESKDGELLATDEETTESGDEGKDGELLATDEETTESGDESKDGELLANDETTESGDESKDGELLAHDEETTESSDKDESLLAACGAGKCPVQMIEKLRQEKQAEEQNA